MILLLLACGGPPESVRFVGDVTLARGVGEELAQRGTPWPATAERWVGNLEGTLAVGPATRSTLALGFPSLEPLRGSPFLALSQANNHARDHGPEGYAATAAGLRALGIAPVGGDAVAIHAAGVDWAFVGVDLTGRPVGEAGEDAASGETAADRLSVPAQPGVAARLEEARLRLSRARAWTPYVVALPHWGEEGSGDVLPGVERAAEVLHAWGATLVMGSHPHVPGPADCASGTWYSLGNFLFDGTDPATWTSLTVACSPVPGGLSCRTEEARRTARSTFPTLSGEPGPACFVAAPEPDRGWLRHPHADALVTVEAFPPAGEHAYLALHRRASTFDDTTALRPYVFRLDGDRVVELWRGTALSRPLVALRGFDWDGERLVCAIERGDSFLRPDPTTSARVHAVYRWSGFGFRAVEDEGAQGVCGRM